MILVPPDVAYVLPHERERDAPLKFEPPPAHPITMSGVLAGHVHLLERLLADDRLVEEHVGQERAEAVLLLPVGGHRGLDAFGDSDPEGPWMVRVLGQELPSDSRVRSDGLA